MRGLALAVACVAGCGGEDITGPARGMVTVVTAPGARVDFMSATTDGVIISGTTDQDGRISTIIDHGDRAVIVLAPAAETPIVVLDQLIPEQEYHWYLDRPVAPVPLEVMLSWPDVPGADYYQVESRCGGATSSFAVSPATVVVCGSGDAMLVSAFAANSDLVATAYQQVTAQFPNQAITLTEPFQPPRDVAFTVLGAPSADIGVFATLHTADGVAFQAQPDLVTMRPTRFPDLDGMLHAQATTFAPFTPVESFKEVIDQRPIRDTVTLDFATPPLPALVSVATFHKQTMIYDWTVDGDAIPDATVIELRTVTENPLTVIAPYRGPRIHVPTLPSNVSEAATPAEIIPILLAGPGGYPAVVNAYGQRNDPARPAFQLVTSSYYDGRL